MRNRWLTRLMGGMAALFVSAVLLFPLAYSGILNEKPNTVLVAGKCDCSKCSSSQVCCPTANGYCGCFPKGIKC